MKKKSILILVICIVSYVNISGSAEFRNSKGSYLKSFVNANDSSICLQIANNYLRIDFINPSVFRIRMNNKDNFPEGGMVKYGIVNTKMSAS